MAYEMWMMEQVRVTARRLGSPVTLLGGAPDPYEQRMIKSATPTLRPTFDQFPPPHGPVPMAHSRP